MEELASFVNEHVATATQSKLGSKSHSQTPGQTISADQGHVCCRVRKAPHQNFLKNSFPVHSSSTGDSADHGWSLFACLRELPDPGGRVEMGVGGQASGRARPRKRPQG